MLILPAFTLPDILAVTPVNVAFEFTFPPVILPAMLLLELLGIPIVSLVPSKVILESSFRIAIEDDIAIPQRICSTMKTRNFGAIFFNLVGLG